MDKKLTLLDSDLKNLSSLLPLEDNAVISLLIWKHTLKALQDLSFLNQDLASHFNAYLKTKYKEACSDKSKKSLD